MEPRHENLESDDAPTLELEEHEEPWPDDLLELDQIRENTDPELRALYGDLDDWQRERRGDQHTLQRVV